MRSILFLKLSIIVFVFILIRHCAIRQIWIPAEEHLRRIDRRDCTPDEAIMNAFGRDPFKPFARTAFMLAPEATKCDWARMHFIESQNNKDCHLPMLAHAELTLDRYQERGKEFIVGTKDCPLILWKRDKQENWQRFFAVWYKGDDGTIQWDLEPYKDNDAE